MKSSIPKLLHDICGKPMLRWVIDSISNSGVDETLVVISTELDNSEEIHKMPVSLISQNIPLGTGHAVQQANKVLASFEGNLLIVNGDTPAIKPETLSSFVRHHEASGASITVMTCNDPPNENMGLVARNDYTDEITAIMEFKDENYYVSRGGEFNVGAYCIKSDFLQAVLGRIPESSNKEFYITRLIEIACSERLEIGSYKIEDPLEAMGVNNLLELSKVRNVLQNRINNYWLLNGIDLIEPCYIDVHVYIDKDCVIYQNTSLKGNTRIGKRSNIGPNSRLLDSLIGPDCNIFESVVEGATVKDRVNIGPFSHLRYGSYIESGVNIGNFAEIKNTIIGKDTLVGHFSYLGDSDIGAKVNIGAGTITCNFDGYQKHQTIIEEGAFIGSATKLIAPVKIGSYSVTGAGSIVTKDVAPGTTVVGMPARVINNNTSLIAKYNQKDNLSGY